MRTCVRDVFAIYDNNILPRLIINYNNFPIEIARTDDFLSTGTRLVGIKHRVSASLV